MPSKTITPPSAVRDSFGMPERISRKPATILAEYESILLLAENGWTLGRIAAYLNLLPIDVARKLLFPRYKWSTPACGVDFSIRSRRARELLLRLYRATSNTSGLILPAKERRDRRAQIKLLVRDGYVTLRQNPGSPGQRTALRVTAHGEAAALLLMESV
ncbi:MAG: hypothetical protein GY798_26295 [Hyphomicrobiales bacterium]|nr:hypothetical protein [Hyphomicrobiales bacterium]